MSPTNPVTTFPAACGMVSGIYYLSFFCVSHRLFVYSRKCLLNFHALEAIICIVFEVLTSFSRAGGSPVHDTATASVIVIVLGFVKCEFFW